MNESYDNHISWVCDFIMTNLDNNLSLDEISRVAAISKYHFNRIFIARVGISIFTYLKLMRLKRASYELAFNKETKILDIALNAQYDSAEAFSRAFKQVFSCTPSSFRKSPDWEHWHEVYSFSQRTLKEEEMDVEIKKFERIKLAVLEYSGDPKRLNEAIPKFIEWRKASGESPVTSHRTFGLVYNDPNNTAPEEFRFDICGEIKEDLKVNQSGIIQKEIPAGKYAVVRHLGSRDTMDDKIYQLYQQWLPQSSEKVRDFPLFFQYHNFFPETAEADLITDIYLPIA